MKMTPAFRISRYACTFPPSDAKVHVPLNLNRDYCILYCMIMIIVHTPLQN